MLDAHEQKLAAIRLAFGVVAAAVIWPVFARRGVEGYFADDVTRAWVAGVGGLAVLVWLATAAWSSFEKARGAVLQDERDAAIRLRAARITLGATNLYVLAGAVFLTESYFDSTARGGYVPASCVFVFALTVLFATFTVQALATLVLYRSGSSDAAHGS